ncbi:ABC transporter substrate-binding protein [Paenibacillus piri]|uniref:ABC transporter substrate-binding protein n=1 Tax=Paenibacillus piri TaxID=2547395 RepID=A0A4R5KHE5_9BACL|nr:ABC transporter substrate-binding protein [Paenibacillus piri]TDF94168.1 ABC transporter substrate-binding protein [Paenibacillus piri]
MKKTGMILASVMLAGSVLSGCASSGKTTEPAASGKEASAINLKYWVPFSGGDGDFMKAMVDKFNQSQKEIKVEILNVKNEEYYTKLRTALVAKQGPDVSVAHVSKLPELVSTNALESLDDVAKEAGVDWSSFTPNILNSTIYNSKHIAIPLDTHAEIMFYNKKILGDAGLLDANGKPKIAQGADGFMAFLKEIKAKVPADVMPLATTSNGNQPYWIWWTLYSQMGGKMLSDDGKKATINNEKSVKALQLMANMVKEGYWPKNIKNGGEIFTTGKAAISLNGVWFTGAAEQAKGLEFGAIPVPQLYEKKAVWGDSHTLVVPMQAKKDQAKFVAAVKFANWLADNGVMWSKAGHVPSKPAIIGSQEFKSQPYRSDYVEIANYVSYTPNHDKVPAISDILRANFDLLMNGQATAEDVLKKAEKEANDLLAK